MLHLKNKEEMIKRNHLAKMSKVHRTQMIAFQEVEEDWEVPT